MEVLSLSLTLGSIKENLSGVNVGVCLGIQRMRATRQEGGNVRAGVLRAG